MTYMQKDNGGLVWGPLVEGTLVKRYKRFLADVKLRNNHLVTAHCPNTGSMKTCSEPGWTVFLSRHDDPKRKLKYTWEMIEAPDSLIGVNTVVPNKLVAGGCEAGKIHELRGYDEIRPEVKTDPHTRLDLLLQGRGMKPCYTEVKNCTLVEDGLACFPDAVTLRGQKHLDNLVDLVKGGARAVIFFLVQRMDALVFKPADHIDPDYGQKLRAAVGAGVEALAYDVVITPERIDLRGAVPIEL